MPVRIRLAQRGKKKNRTFRVIVADSRSPRDGKFIEDLGYYDPHHNPSMVEIDVDKAVAWLDKGAQPSERAQKILEISGAWAQWRSTKGEVVSIPQAPEEKIKANVIIEGANSPTTLNADKILRDNGIMIIPDILANAGGITASYFEWVQNTQNYLWKETELHEKLIDVMITSFEEVWTISQKQNCDLRTAALIKGIKRVAAAKLTRGLFP